MLAETWPKLVFGGAITVGLAVIGLVVNALVSRAKTKREDRRRWQEPLLAASEKFLAAVQRFRSIAETGSQPNADEMDEAWLALQQIAPMEVSRSAHSLKTSAHSLISSGDTLQEKLDLYRTKRQQYLNELRDALELSPLDDSTEDSAPPPRRSRRGK